MDETVPISYKRKICGDKSSMIVIPNKFMEFLNYEQGDVLDINIKKGKHGHYLIMWCEEKQSMAKLTTE